jgi:hypothetical protein
MKLNEYQEKALATSTVGKKNNPRSATAPLLGLGHAVGCLENTYKRFLRDESYDIEPNKAFLQQELGAVLWYTAVVSATLGLELEDVASINLQLARNRYGASEDRGVGPSIKLDDGYSDDQRFPRRLTVQFKEEEADPPTARMILVDAHPNAFPNGKVVLAGDKYQGFDLHKQLGDTLNDNSNYGDGYRYHDSIHFGFLAVLGWSPTVRALLHVKRYSDKKVDHAQDGARAMFLEEGLAAALAQLSKGRGGFLQESYVDGQVLDIVGMLTEDLEVSQWPLWRWRAAISQGFSAFAELRKNRGGFLIVDLDARRLSYTRSL